MKILQINTVYKSGSTGKIVAAIESLSLVNNHDAYVGYGRGSKDNDSRHMRIGNKLDFYGHVLVNFYTGRNGFASIQVTKRFLEWVDDIKPDLIHLHNIHGFYIHIGILFAYIKEHNIPVVWTLHDCWPITGQCAHFDYACCDKWKKECHDCPIYRSDYPYSLFKDNSIQNMQSKKEIFLGVNNLTIVTPSMWLKDIVSESFLKGYPVKVINNGINLDVFNKSYAKKDDSYRIILAVANVWDNRKGLDYILRLSDDYNQTTGYQIVIIGLTRMQQRKLIRQYPDKNIIPICHTFNQWELAEWYRKAYVYVNPTLQDNYPTTNLEAIACGTPVITFNTGGSPESLDENTGIVVDKCNYKQLKSAILHVEALQERLDKVDLSRFNEKERFREYIELYKQIYENML